MIKLFKKASSARLLRWIETATTILAERGVGVSVHYQKQR